MKSIVLENGGINMEENSNIIKLTDDQGVERDFEVVTVLKVEDTDYAVLYDLSDEEEESAVVFRIGQDEAGEDILEVVEDDEEFERVSVVYEQWLDEEEFEEE